MSHRDWQKKEIKGRTLAIYKVICICRWQEIRSKKLSDKKEQHMIPAQAIVRKVEKQKQKPEDRNKHQGNNGDMLLSPQKEQTAL